MTTTDAVGAPVNASLRTDDFDFDLPPELIAQHPVSPRDSSRMLAVDAELRDLGEQDPACFPELQASLDTWLARMEAERQPGIEIELTPAEAKRLKALGYGE